MEAHEVRLLCYCPVCGKLGGEQTMVKVGPMKTLSRFSTCETKLTA